MKHSLPFILISTLLLSSVHSLRLFTSGVQHSQNPKQSHHGKLTNFTFSLFNANFSGASGTYFDDRLVSIQFKFIDKDSRIQTKSQQYGPTWGYPFDWSVPKNDKVKSIQFWKQEFFVDGIQFVTQNGKRSPLFGVQSGEHTVQDLNGSNIVGLEGVYCGGGVRTLQPILQ